MSRYFERLTAEELDNKIEEAVKATGLRRERSWKSLTPQVRKDLLKCRFDLENVDDSGLYRNQDIVGCHTLSNGFTFHGFSAGGDWEQPVFFIIYWDGTQLRGYIPKDGNPWNTTTGYPYGNDDDADARNLKKRYPQRFVGVNLDDCDSALVYTDPELIKQDIIKRIVEK